MAVEGSVERVAEGCLRRERTVLQAHLKLRYEVLIRLLILADVGELQVEQLQHRLHVLRCRRTAGHHVASTHAHTGSGNLSSQSFREFLRRETAESAGADGIIQQLQVAIVLRSVERLTAGTLARKHHLVFLEIGVLHEHSDTIREFQLGVAELLVLRFLLNLAGLGQLGNERFVLHIVHIGLQLLRASIADGGEQAFACGIGVAFLLIVERHDDHVRILLHHLEQLFGEAVDGLEGNSGNQLIHRLIGILNRRHGLVGKEMTAALTIELRVGALLTVRIRLLERAQVVGLVAVVLGLCESELCHTASLLKHRLQSFAHHRHLLWHDIEVEGALRFREDVVAITASCIHKRAAFLLGDFRETAVEQRQRGTFHIVINKVRHVLLQRVGIGIVFEHHLYTRRALLLVLVDDDNGFLRVGHGLSYDRCCILGVRDVGEEFLDHRFGVVYVDITHDDESLIGGMIPLLIVVAQLLRTEVIDNRHQTDGIAHTVFRIGIEGRQVAFQHTTAGRGAHAPLLMDDTTLLVDFLGFEQKARRPVAQDEQARVERRLTCCRHVVDVVDRLVDRGVSIQVGSELHTNGLQPRDELVALEVIRTVEGHVFQEVGESALALLLLNGTHLLCDVEVGAVLRPVVVTNVVGQPVVELSDAYGLIHRDGRHLLGLSSCAYEHQQRCKKIS